MRTKSNDFKSELQNEIVNNYGSISGLKNHLVKTATNKYGNFTSEVRLLNCRIVYTDNQNCFASFLINIPTIGMVGQKALDKKSITKAGENRGSGNQYLFK